MAVFSDVVIEPGEASELALGPLDVFDEVVFRVRRPVLFFLLLEPLVDSLDVFQVVQPFLPP